MATVKKGLFGLKQFYDGTWHGSKHMVDVLNKIIEAKDGSGSNSVGKLDQYKKDKATLEADIVGGKHKLGAVYLKMVQNQIKNIDNAILKIERGNTVKKQNSDTRNMSLVNELITANKKVMALMESLEKEHASWAKNPAPRIKAPKS
jgi:hypothetical protein